MRIKTWLGIYGQIQPFGKGFAFRSSLKVHPRELPQVKGYIWPCIPRRVLKQIQDNKDNFDIWNIYTLKYHQKQKQFYLCDIGVLHMPVGDLPEAGHVVTWTEILPSREKNWIQAILY